MRNERLCGLPFYFLPSVRDGRFHACRQATRDHTDKLGHLGLKMSPIAEGASFSPSVPPPPTPSHLSFLCNNPFSLIKRCDMLPNAFRIFCSTLQFSCNILSSTHTHTHTTHCNHFLFTYHYLSVPFSFSSYLPNFIIMKGHL